MFNPVPPQIASDLRYITSSGEDYPTTPPDGAELHVVDTGATFIAWKGVWLPDLRLTQAIRTAMDLQLG